MELAKYKACICEGSAENASLIRNGGMPVRIPVRLPR